MNYIIIYKNSCNWRHWESDNLFQNLTACLEQFLKAVFFYFFCYVKIKKMFN